MNSRVGKVASLVFAGFSGSSEGDIAVVDGRDAVIGYGNAVGVSAQVFDDVFRTVERLSTVDVPVRGIEFSEEAPEDRRCLDIEVAAVDGVFEQGEQFSSEQSGEHVDVDEEGVAGGHPGVVVW